jgi:DNA-binding NtrC family response regulator
MKILVVQLSESFGGLWDQLAGDVESGICLIGDDDPYRVASDVVAVVLAAGGAERDALEWLEAHTTATSAPLYAVGADPERRIGLQLVGSGASDYFALPEDLELLRNALASAVSRRRETLRRDARAMMDARPEAFATIIGESPALKAVLARAARLLPHRQANALIIGENRHREGAAGAGDSRRRTAPN